MPTLSYNLRRAVAWDELHSLIYGTGALTLPWWQDVTYTTRDDSPEGNWQSVIFVTTDPDSGRVETRPIAPARILEALQTRYAGRFDELHADVREAITDDLGLLDAFEADAVLQIAVFGSVVYG